ncbi:hypothetical protein J2Z31_001275 [Sinorhizobium kostiense]|uniref:Uncharacterized protein n=1 Tax=Sinorhizobium kostiense TaxID=76747 RepID=A0ABS4QVW7_9HYPH|nr:hypothetical protein [Sinorhizobium kostiense]
MRLVQLGEVVGVLIHVLAVPWLIGSAVAASIRGDDPVTPHAEIKKLGVAGVERRLWVDLSGSHPS